jgi:hypothetical protein
MIREKKKSKKIFHIILQIAMNSWKSFIEWRILPWYNIILY